MWLKMIYCAPRTEYLKEQATSSFLLHIGKKGKNKKSFSSFDSSVEKYNYGRLHALLHDVQQEGGRNYENLSPFICNTVSIITY